MTLGRKLFLLIGGMLCLLLVGQWLLYRSLAKRVSDDVRTVAFRVGEEIVSGFEYRFETDGETPDAEGRLTAAEAMRRIGPPDPQTLPEVGASSGHARVFVLRGDGSSQVPVPVPGASASDAAQAGAPGPEGDSRQFVVKREFRWKRADERTTTSAGSASGPEQERRPFAIDVDEDADVLLLRGPESARSIPIPRRSVSTTLERFGSQLLLGNLALLAVGLAAAAWLAHRMSRPLAELADAAERVGAGELGAAVPLATSGRSDEVGRAVGSFNRMSARLVELDGENRRLSELEQLSELGDVARGLAHSLRNPLNALGLTIERLGARIPASPPGEGAPEAGAPPASGSSRASVDELVDGSRRQIRRIDGALRSFLALASAGGAQSEDVDLGALAREVALEALHDAAAGEGPRIEVDVASSERLVVEGVPAELKAILQALVVNGCEAAQRARLDDPGGSGRSATGGLLSIQVKGATVPDRAGVTVVVEDDGPGVAESVRERLFTPHVTTKPHGSGMGLFLAHRLATARYRGALRLEPRASGGTRAVLELSNRAKATP